MRPNYKPNLHNRPKHILQDNSFYFITCRTIDGQWFLRPDAFKQILLSKIKEKIAKFNSPLLAYVILPNHYHFIIKVLDASQIPKLIAQINGSSSREINKADHSIERKIWWNYYDHIIRDKNDFFKHLNYIHQNPIKHGIAKSFDYEFSSYKSWLSKKGKEYLDDTFRKYPIIDFVAGMDDF